MYKSLIYITFGAILITVTACGGDDKKDPEAIPDEATGGTTGSESESVEGDQSADPSGEEGTTSCGNGIVESEFYEQCDDGNDNDADGCTHLCKYTCTNHDDCDDLNPCNGSETCLDDHTCSPGTETISDGEPCGDDASCSDGECVEHICGNGVTQGDEECDDGDDLDDNGCTKECLFTCVATRDTETVVNDCNPNATCNETTHIWEGGHPLPDGTLCHRGEGYCQNGVCVLATCGDGVQEPNEDCDLGDQNGVEGSGCTATCTDTVCGNGVIEGKEMCDDGNTENLDGCDYKCVPEVTYRGTSLRVSMEPAPDYCVYAGNERNGNAFGELFTSQGLLDIVNGLLQGMFDDGSVHALFHVMDMEDYEPTKPDPLARLGLSMGEPVQDWLSSPVKLDLEFYAYRDYFDDFLQPLSAVPGAMIMEGDRQVVVSTAPTVAGFLIVDMEFVLHDMMARIETDDSLSPLPPPPETVEGLVVPTSVGAHGTGVPTGVLCGALHEDVFRRMPLPPALLVLCLDQLLAGTYTPCEEGMDFQAGECDSVLTLFQGGCTDLGAPFLNPLRDPDVDTDGDGTYDAYTAVLRASAERVKVVGVTDMPPIEEMIPAL